jgi:hypothetical protein
MKLVWCIYKRSWESEAVWLGLCRAEWAAPAQISLRETLNTTNCTSLHAYRCGDGNTGGWCCAHLNMNCNILLPSKMQHCVVSMISMRGGPSLPTRTSYTRDGFECWVRCDPGQRSVLDKGIKKNAPAHNHYAKKTNEKAQKPNLRAPRSTTRQIWPVHDHRCNHLWFN